MTQRGRTIADLIAENKAIVIIILMCLAGVLFWLVKENIPVKIGSVEVGAKSETSNTEKNDRNPNVNGNNNVTGNNNNVYQIHQQSSPKPQNLYSISGTNNQKLINQIANFKKIEFVPNSQKYIKITYTGAIQPYASGSDTFYYTGGVVKLIVNDNCTFEFKDLKIDEMRPSSKSSISEELDNRVNYYVNSNRQQFLNEILKCID